MNNTETNIPTATGTSICSLCGYPVLPEESITIVTQGEDDVLMHWLCVMSFRKPEEEKIIQ